MQTNEWKIKFESLERMFRACHNVSQEENEKLRQELERVKAKNDELRKQVKELKDRAKGESA